MVDEQPACNYISRVMVIMQLGFFRLHRNFLMPPVLALLLLGCSSGSLPSNVPATSTAEPSIVPLDTPTCISIIIPVPTSTPTISPTPTPDVFAAEFPLGDVAYVLPLTIRHITPTRAVLFFELDQAVEGILFYQVDGAAAGGELPFDADAVRHQLTLNVLVPGTTYKIRVGIPGADGEFTEPHFLGEKWGPFTVHTPAEINPLRFGVIGDASFGDSVTASLVEQMAAANLDFVLHTGDVVDETELNADPFESYAHKYYQTFAPLLQQLPVYTVPGNHDYDPDIRWQGEPFYFNAFPPFEDPRIPASGTSQYYAFVMDGLQFIMLDSQVFFGIAGREAEQSWLIERLGDDRFQASIAVFHVSPFSSSSVHRNEGVPVRDSWSPLFQEANIPLVFSGHTHQYERLQVNNVTYIVSGGGSSITYAGGELLPQSQVFARKSHFVLVVVYPDRLELTSFSVAGETIDQVDIQLP